jgi:hypothetical protein
MLYGKYITKIDGKDDIGPENEQNCEPYGELLEFPTPPTNVPAPATTLTTTTATTPAPAPATTLTTTAPATAPAPAPAPATAPAPAPAPDIITTATDTIKQFIIPARTALNCEDIVPEIPIGKRKQIKNDNWSFYNCILAGQNKEYGNNEAQALAKKIRTFIVKPENIQRFTDLYDQVPTVSKDKYKNFSEYLTSMTIKEKSGDAKEPPLVSIIGPAAAAITGSIIAVYSDSGNNDDVFCPPTFKKNTPVIQIVFNDDKEYDVVIPSESEIKTTTTDTTQTIIAGPAPAPAPALGENVVDRLLKKVSCDISDRRYEEQLVQDQQKALEIRKRVLEEIAKEKTTPAAKTKADFTQASREELLTFVVENAKEKLPTYEEWVKNPTFYKTVTDKLNAQQKTEFDKLFEKTYPDLYKLQLQSNQGSQWKWPTFITEEQKNKIRADVKANNNISLKEIMDSLNLTDEQKKELGTEWGKGLQKSLQNNVTKPNDVDQKDWDSVISGIKNGTIKKLKEAQEKGTASKIDGNLWGKMVQQYRSKTGGGTKRNILNNRRTVRRI